MQKKLNGFTLAEVLITLAIIGVVAAMTIPTLISKINDSVTANQKEVFNTKMVKGLNLTKAAGELNSTYSSTFDFLTNGLGKHLKLAKICDSSHIRECVPYENITYDAGTEKNVKVSELSTIDKISLKSKDGFRDVASFVTGDGTIVIASYKLDCLQDEDKQDVSINSCLAGFYDLNGTRKPNKMGKDLINFNGAGIKGMVLATLGGVKLISNAQVYDGILTSEYCIDGEPIKEYKDVGVQSCCTECDPQGGDRWAVAALACADMGGHLPTEKQLADMANALYGGKSDGTSFTGNDARLVYYDTAGPIGSKEAIPTPLSGIGSSWTHLWASKEALPRFSHYRGFERSVSWRNYYDYRYDSETRAVCVVD